MSRGVRARVRPAHLPRPQAWVLALPACVPPSGQEGLYQHLHRQVCQDSAPEVFSWGTYTVMFARLLYGKQKLYHTFELRHLF